MSSPQEIQEIKAGALYSREEAREYLKTSFQTLWRWNKSGVLHARKIGGCVRYRGKDILNLTGGGENE